MAKAVSEVLSPVCPKCGRVPYAGADQKCAECHRIASRESMRRSRAKRFAGDFKTPPASQLPETTDAELYELAKARAEQLHEDPDCPPHIAVQVAKLITAVWRDELQSQKDEPTSDPRFGLTEEEYEEAVREIRAKHGKEVPPASSPVRGDKSINELYLYDLSLRRLRWLLVTPETPPHLVLQALKVVLPWRHDLSESRMKKNKDIFLHLIGYASRKKRALAAEQDPDPLETSSNGAHPTR